MSNLYFLSSYGEKRLVRENIDPETAIGYINEYTHSLNPNYKIYLRYNRAMVSALTMYAVIK